MTSANLASAWCIAVVEVQKYHAARAEELFSPIGSTWAARLMRPYAEQCKALLSMTPSFEDCIPVMQAYVDCYEARMKNFCSDSDAESDAEYALVLIADLYKQAQTILVMSESTP